MSFEADKVEFLSGEIQEQSSHIVVAIASTASNRFLTAPASSFPLDTRSAGWDATLCNSAAYGSVDSMAVGEEEQSRDSLSLSSDAASHPKTSSLERSKHRVSNFLKGLWTGKSYSSHLSLEALNNLQLTDNPALQNSSAGFSHNFSPLPYTIGTSYSSTEAGDRRSSLVSMVSRSQESPVPMTQIVPTEFHSQCTELRALDPGKNSLDPYIKSPLVQSSDQLQFDSDSSERKISPPIMKRASSCQILESTLARQIPTLEVSRTSRSNSVEDSTVEALDGRYLRRSASAQDARGTPVSLFPPRSCSVLGAPVHSSSRRGSLNNLQVDSEDKVHLYTITVNSLLYKLLYTLWRNKRLRGHRQSDDQGNVTKMTISTGPTSPRSDHAFHIPASVEEGFWQLKTELLAANSVDDCYLLVKELNSGLVKLHKIKTLFWQDASFVTRLLSLLSQYLAVQPKKFLETPVQSNNGRAPFNRKRFTEEIGSSNQEQRQEELELCVLLYDTLIESFCDAHKLMVKVLSNNDYKVTSQILSTMLTPASLPNSLRLTCDRWLTDATAFSEEAISNLPCAAVAQLVVRCMELSITAAHRLLLSLSEDLHNTPHLSNIFKSCHLKPWLRYAVPLIIARLRGPGRRLGSLDTAADGLPDPADETETLQVYLSVLSTLLDSSSRAQRFCLRHFKEEIKYFITAEQVEATMEGYTDAATLEMCVTLAENIRYRLAV
ncbi:Protein of unknown function DUF4551 [Trinorchestia longiramus]|nr:Protein of unknown function DUF4551 [Trinorchestia longiramus]